MGIIGDAWEWISDAGSAVVDEAASIVQGAGDLIEAGVETAHDDLRDVISWGGEEVDKTRDLIGTVAVKAEDLAYHAVDEVGGVATTAMDDASSTLSMPLTLLAGGALLFLMASGRNSSFSYSR